jgi:hypothetical protein
VGRERSDHGNPSLVEPHDYCQDSAAAPSHAYRL